MAENELRIDLADAGAVRPLVWPIIPHYGKRALLRRCLEGLEAQDCCPAIVIDSNPPHERRYFTAAVNAGMYQAIRAQWACPTFEQPAAYWILNNDAVPQPGCAAAALRRFQEVGWDRCGIVGSRVVRHDNPDRISWGGSKECFPAGRHKTGSVAAGDLAEATEEEWATFCSVFVNAALVQEIGVLDASLRHICSDADYCLRARAAGWSVWYEPASVVQHGGGNSSSRPTVEIASVNQADVQIFGDKWIAPLARFHSLTRYHVQMKGGADGTQARA